MESIREQMDLTNEISDAISNPVGIHSDVRLLSFPPEALLIRKYSHWMAFSWTSLNCRLSWTALSKTNWTNVSQALSQSQLTHLYPRSTQVSLLCCTHKNLAVLKSFILLRRSGTSREDARGGRRRGRVARAASSIGGLNGSQSQRRGVDRAFILSFLLFFSLPDFTTTVNIHNAHHPSHLFVNLACRLFVCCERL